MKAATVRSGLPAHTGAPATPWFPGAKSSRGTGISATTGTGTPKVSWTSTPTGSTHGRAFRTRLHRLRLVSRIRLLRRSLCRRIALGTRRSWRRRGAAGCKRSARLCATKSSVPTLQFNEKSSVAPVSLEAGHNHSCFDEPLIPSSLRPAW